MTFARLAAMMFLNYVIWGAWYVTIGTWLTQTLGFSGTEAGAIFGTAALSCMITPLFAGQIADRYFAAERLMALLHLIGAGLLFLIAQSTTFTSVYGLLLAYNLCFFPTISLTNSIALRHIKDAASQFPLIRVFATIGWIVIGVVVGSLGIERSSTPFYISAACSVVMSALSLVLPHTPPEGRGKPMSWRTAIGMDAIVLLKDRSYAVFVVASVLACIPLTFYFSFTNAYLNDAGVQNAAGKMTLGQASEVIMMLLMPFVYRRFGLKTILLAGLLTWAARYVMLAFGNSDERMYLFYLAILVHGICFDFFFMTGQIYTDTIAPSHLRITAQGFLQFLTYGVGMFVGSILSGVVVDMFTTTEGGQVIRNWLPFWLTSGAGAFVIFLLVAAFFRTNAKLTQQAVPEPQPELLKS